jgi:Spy/CpxP family protein refolding chaperone
MALLSDKVAPGAARQADGIRERQTTQSMIFYMSNTRSNDAICMISAAKLAKYCVGVLLLLALWFDGASALAQAPEATTPQPQVNQRPSRRSNIDARVSMLAKSLDLTAEQQSAVKNILEQRQQKTLLIRRDPSISGSARIERFRMLQESTVERIRAVLNDEQKKRYDPMAASHMQSTPEHSVEDWLKATSPK